MKEVNGVTCFSDLSELLDPRHVALVVVDMQNDLCLPEGWMAKEARRDLAGIQAIIPNLAGLVRSARAAGVNVVFIQQTTLPRSMSDSPAWTYFKTRDGRTRTDYTVDGTWGHEVIDGLGALEDDVRVRKNRPSSFHETNLSTILRAAGVETVVVTGTITQGCVMATVLDASFHDFYVVVADDCVQSYSQELHQLALALMASRYDVVPAAAIVREGGWG